MPIVLKFLAVDFGPRLDQPLLRPRQAPSNALDCVDRERCRRILIVRVEVRPVMGPRGSANIRITMPKNREISGTGNASSFSAD